jgi:hypothetical protein
MVQILHLPKTFECPLFWSCFSIKNYGIEVTFNGIIFLLNFVKMYQLAQMSIGGTDTQTEW